MNDKKSICKVRHGWRQSDLRIEWKISSPRRNVLLLKIIRSIPSLSNRFNSIKSRRGHHIHEQAITAKRSWHWERVIKKEFARLASACQNSEEKFDDWPGIWKFRDVKCDQKNLPIAHKKIWNQLEVWQMSMTYKEKGGAGQKQNSSWKHW